MAVLSKLYKLKKQIFTKYNLYTYFLPMEGLICYSALSLRLMCPTIFRALPRRDVSNVLIIGSCAYISTSIYRRAYMSLLPKQKRLIYAAGGAAFFGLGSILAWALMKSLLPKNQNMLNFVVGIISGAGFLKVGADYLDDCDKMVKGKHSLCTSASDTQAN